MLTKTDKPVGEKNSIKNALNSASEVERTPRTLNVSMVKRYIRNRHLNKNEIAKMLNEFND